MVLPKQVEGSYQRTIIFVTMELDRMYTDSMYRFKGEPR